MMYTCHQSHIAYKDPLGEPSAISRWVAAVPAGHADTGLSQASIDSTRIYRAILS